MNHSSGNPTRIVNLNSVIERILHSEPEVEEIFLFGSRAYKTGSIRSDIDILVVTKGNINQNLWCYIRKFEPYVDLFQLIGPNALSLGNGSQINSDTKENLIKKIDAKKVWDRNNGWVGSSEELNMEVLSNYHPELTTAELMGFPDPAHNFDFLILTSLPEEFNAAINRLRLSKRSGEISVSSDFVICTLKTKTGTRKIAISKSNKMGPIAAALNTQKSIWALTPNFVILIGITAGTKDDVNLGDIIVPDRIVDYESVKIDENGKSSHGSIPTTYSSMRQKFSTWLDREDWRKNITSTILPPRPDIRQINIIEDVAMASGNKVIADPALIEEIQQLFGRKIVAFEMEAIGVAEACETKQIPFMVIKSVSDFADSNKDDSWHPFCCEVSADLTLRLIEEEVI